MTTENLESIVKSIIGRDQSSEVLCVDKFLGDDVICLLSEKLKGNQTKRKLVLRGNCIGRGGAEALGSVLKENNNLHFISLEWNQIGEQWVLFIITNNCFELLTTVLWLS